MVWFYPLTFKESPEAAMYLSIPLWSDFILYNVSSTSGSITLFNFQSHYGLILSKFKTSSVYISFPPFNPTMVWFYRLRVDVTTASATAFQSHYGLILSQIRECFVIVRGEPFNPTMVWFYRGTLRRGTGSPRQFLLSIPLWSDFIATGKAARAFIESAFNPTMVWFYPPHYYN